MIGFLKTSKYFIPAKENKYFQCDSASFWLEFTRSLEDVLEFHSEATTDTMHMIKQTIQQLLGIGRRQVTGPLPFCWLCRVGQHQRALQVLVGRTLASIVRNSHRR